MRLARRMLESSMVLSTVLFVLAFGLGRDWRGALLVFLLGCIWWIGNRQRWDWVHFFSFLGYLVSAAIGIWEGLPTAVLLVGFVFVICGWDLGQFQSRMNCILPDQVLMVMEQNHIRRLVIVLGAGLLAGLTSLSIQIKLSFGLVAFLSLTLVFSLTLGIGYLNRERG